jgi:hypothetical protein
MKSRTITLFLVALGLEIASEDGFGLALERAIGQRRCVRGRARGAAEVAGDFEGDLAVLDASVFDLIVLSAETGDRTCELLAFLLELEDAVAPIDIAKTIAATAFARVSMRSSGSEG